MAENLNYAVEGSKCYGEGGQVLSHTDEDDNPVYVVLTNEEVQDNCKKYGQLYDWATAMALTSTCNSSTCASQVSAKHKGICPSGWHIPSDADWDELATAVGGSSTAGKHLKATNGWNSGGNGEDTYGFAAFPSGTGNNSGNFSSAGNIAYWWSSSEINAKGARFRSMRYNYAIIHANDLEKTGLFSVRCVKD